MSQSSSQPGSQSVSQPESQSSSQPGSQPGKFICLEGIDGAGKTSYCRQLVDFLRSKNYKVVQTKEPGGTPLADELAKILLNFKQEKIVPQTELLLFFAARCQHIHNFIQPQLAQGTWVICDRYIPSSYAYQGAGRGLGNAAVANLEEYLPTLTPDITIVFDIGIEESIKRWRSMGRDRFEEIDNLDKDFYQRVREAYLEYAKSHKECRVLDASLSQDEVWQNMLPLITQLL